MYAPCIGSRHFRHRTNKDIYCHSYNQRNLFVYPVITKIRQYERRLRPSDNAKKSSKVLLLAQKVISDPTSAETSIQIFSSVSSEIVTFLSQGCTHRLIIMVEQSSIYVRPVSLDDLKHSKTAKAVINAAYRSQGRTASNSGCCNKLTH